MKRSNRLILLIGIFLALVAFVLVIVTLQGGGSGSAGPSAAPTTAQVVVAARVIDLGATIVEKDVELKEVPLEAKSLTSYADTSLVVGKVARRPVEKGQQITYFVVKVDQ